MLNAQQRLLVCAGLALGATWLYPVFQLPTEWSSFTQAAMVTAGFAIVALLLFVVSLRAERAWHEIALIIPAVALNMVFSMASATLHMPIALACVGTVAIGAALGPKAGMSTGIATAIVSAMFAPAMIVFTFVYAFVGLCSGVLAQFGSFRNGFLAAVSGLLVGLPDAILSSPMHAMVYDDIATGVHALIAEQHQFGSPIFEAVLDCSMKFDPLDSAVAFGLAWVVLRMTNSLQPVRPAMALAV